VEKEQKDEIISETKTDDETKQKETIEIDNKKQILEPEEYKNNFFLFILIIVSVILYFVYRKKHLKNKF